MKAGRLCPTPHGDRGTIQALGGAPGMDNLPNVSKLAERIQILFPYRLALRRESDSNGVENTCTWQSSNLFNRTL